MKRGLKYFLLGFLILFLIFTMYFFVGKSPQAEEIVWGVNFSQKHSQLLGLDWRTTYLALLDDLKTKDLKVATHWDLFEPEKDEYNFQDLDWQIKEAEKRDAKILLVIGMKTPRWPECHIPSWAQGLNKQEQQNEILEMLRILVLRYKDSSAIYGWQVENEPFFPFGICPWVDKEFVEQEAVLVRDLDRGKHSVVMTDSGEGSFWIQAAQIGDIVGTTMYKKVWVRQLKFYFTYPFSPTFYHRKAQIIKALFNKKVICVELQAEPWGPALLYDSPLEEQEKSMNLSQFRYNIEFAKKTGLDRFYLWGGEWWYWLKEKQNQPEIWQEAKKLFRKQ